MDTELGGLETLAMMQHYESTVLILDTLSRVVRGEENSNDTYRNFYAYTGRLLKANGDSPISPRSCGARYQKVSGGECESR